MVALTPRCVQNTTQPFQVHEYHSLKKQLRYPHPKHHLNYEQEQPSSILGV